MAGKFGFSSAMAVAKRKKEDMMGDDEMHDRMHMEEPSGDEDFKEEETWHEDPFGIADYEADEESDKAKNKKRMFAQSYMVHRSMRGR